MCVNRFLTIIVVPLVLGLSGCGSSDRVTVYPVRGTVTLEGSAMPGGGSIAFIPLKQQAGKTAGGEIRENGTYELTTYDPGDGSMVGDFRVLITQTVALEPNQAPPDGQALPQGGLTGLQVAPEDQIPLAYSDPAKSPLKATVEAKRSNEINFDLKRKLEGMQESAPAGVAASPRRGNGTRVYEFVVTLSQNDAHRPAVAAATTAAGQR